MADSLELPSREATKIHADGEWVFIEQEDHLQDRQTIAIHKNDLQQVIDTLCDIANIGGKRP